jgi:hypothetical protein
VLNASNGPGSRWEILKGHSPSGRHVLEYTDLYRFGAAYSQAERGVALYSKLRQPIGIALGVAALAAAALVFYLVNPSVEPADPSAVTTPAAPVPLAEAPDLHPRALPASPTAASKPAPPAEEPVVSRRRAERVTVTTLPAQEPLPAPPVGKPSVRRDAAPGPAPAAQQPGTVVAYVASSQIYSAANADVIPPEPTHPQELTGMRTGAVGPSSIVTLEVVVNSQGLVEAAWSRTSPNNVGEALVLATSLHAVKAWQFHPAVKDGTPVPYRKLISFEGF